MRGRRFHIYRGDSRKTLPAFIEQRKGKNAGSTPPLCDVMLVDGDHRLSGAQSDLAAFRELSVCNGTLFADDLQEAPGQALRAAKNAGWVAADEWYSYRKGDAVNNPCMRGVKGGLRCPTHDGWGWGRARMVGAAACGTGKS